MRNIQFTVQNWHVCTVLGHENVAFEKQGHSYGIDEQGRKILSVTQLAAPPMPFASKALQSAAAKGAAVHEELDSWIKSGCQNRLSASAQTLASRFWLYKTKRSRRISELPFICTLSASGQAFSYAGTIDLAEFLSGRAAALFDWKTGKAHHWHVLQAALYSFALSGPAAYLVYFDAIKPVKTACQPQQIAALIQEKGKTLWKETA